MSILAAVKNRQKKKGGENMLEIVMKKMDIDAYDRIKKSGFDAAAIRGGFVVYFRNYESMKKFSRQFPDVFAEGEKFVIESGGLKWDDNKGWYFRVVTNEKGKLLKPLYKNIFASQAVYILCVSEQDVWIERSDWNGKYTFYTGKTDNLSDERLERFFAAIVWGLEKLKEEKQKKGEKNEDKKENNLTPERC